MRARPARMWLKSDFRASEDLDLRNETIRNAAGVTTRLQIQRLLWHDYSLKIWFTSSPLLDLIVYKNSGRSEEVWPPTEAKINLVSVRKEKRKNIFLTYVEFSSVSVPYFLILVGKRNSVNRSV